MAMGDEEGFVTLIDARHCINTEQLKAKSWSKYFLFFFILLNKNYFKIFKKKKLFLNLVF